MEPVLTAIQREAGYTLDRPVAGVKQRDPQSLTFTPVSNLDSPVNPTLLTACVWTIRRKQSTWREPTQTLGEYSHRKALEPRTLLL